LAFLGIRLKKLKFGKILRGIVGTIIPPLKGPLEAGAAALRNAKNKGKSVSEQGAAALEAGIGQTEQARNQKMLLWGVLGLGGVVVLTLLLRKR